MIKSKKKEDSKIISTRDTSFTRKYFVTIDHDVIKHHTTTYNYVSNKIKEVLNDPNGWTKFGYKFQPISVSYGLKLRKIQSMKKYIFHIRLSTNSTIQSICNLDKLSCADMGSNNIYLNVDNWIYGTKASEMTGNKYKKMLSSHEIGHLLGRGHLPWRTDTPNELCGVMHQQSSKPSRKSCKPNEYPLQIDFDL